MLLLVPLQASFTIATIPKRSDSGSVSHACVNSTKPESIADLRDKVWAKVSGPVDVTTLLTLILRAAVS